MVFGLVKTQLYWRRLVFTSLFEFSDYEEDEGGKSPQIYTEHKI